MQSLGKLRNLASLLAFCVSMTAGIKIDRQTTEERLYADLFNGYNADLHPAYQGTGKTSKVTVRFDVQVIRIIDLSERDQYIKTYLWVNQYWNNPRLTWNTTNYPGINSIHVSSSKVWVPDIVLYNNVGSDSGASSVDIYKQKVSISSDGNHTWMNQAIYTSICKIDVSYFPFDDQNCKLKFGSWSFDAAKVDMQFLGGKYVQNEYYVPNGGWDLRHLNATRNELFYQCCPEPFVDITVSLSLRRVALSYTLNLIIPSALLSSLVVLGFLLPPESGERISLSITILLSVTVFQQLTSSIMPQYDFPYMARYYFVSIMATGLSLIVTTIVLMLYHRPEGTMPPWLKCFLFRILAPLLCFSKEHKSIENAVPGFTTALSGAALIGHEIDDNCSRETIPLNTLQNCHDNMQQDDELHFQLGNGTVKKFMKKLQTTAEKSRMETWRRGARVLDRFFLVIFLLIIGLNFAMIFLQSPRFRDKSS